MAKVCGNRFERSSRTGNLTLESGLWWIGLLGQLGFVRRERRVTIASRNKTQDVSSTWFHCSPLTDSAPIMIHVVAKLTVDPDRRDEFLAAFAELTPLVLAEEGCIEYGSAIDLPTSLPPQELAGEDAVMVIEKWESVPMLEAHLAAPHMAEFREKTGDMLRGVSLQVLQSPSL